MLYTGIGLTLNSVQYTSNSVVTITGIGTGGAALFCTTTYPLCCFSGPPPGTHWYFPNGSRVQNTNTLPYYRTRINGHLSRELGTVLLHRNPGATTTGIFRCEIRDANRDFQSLYVGIYTATTGESCSYIEEKQLCIARACEHWGWEFPNLLMLHRCGGGGVGGEGGAWLSVLFWCAEDSQRLALFPGSQHSVSDCLLKQRGRLEILLRMKTVDRGSWPRECMHSLQWVILPCKHLEFKTLDWRWRMQETYLVGTPLQAYSLCYRMQAWLCPTNSSVLVSWLDMITNFTWLWPILTFMNYVGEPALTMQPLYK